MLRSGVGLQFGTKVLLLLVINNLNGGGSRRRLDETSW